MFGIIIHPKMRKSITFVLRASARLCNMEQRYYVAYLLRLWRTGDGGAPAWRASLEDAHTGSRIGFADLQSLFDYLRRQTEQSASVVMDQEDPS